MQRGLGRRLGRPRRRVGAGAAVTAVRGRPAAGPAAGLRPAGRHGHPDQQDPGAAAGDLAATWSAPRPTSTVEGRRRRGRGAGRARAGAAAPAGARQGMLRRRPEPDSDEEPARCTGGGGGATPAAGPAPARAANRPPPEHSPGAGARRDQPTLGRLEGDYKLPPISLLRPGERRAGPQQGQRRGHQRAARRLRTVRCGRRGHRLRPGPDRHPVRGGARARASRSSGSPSCPATSRTR